MFAAELASEILAAKFGKIPLTERFAALQIDFPAGCRIRKTGEEYQIAAQVSMAIGVFNWGDQFSQSDSFQIKADRKSAAEILIARPA